MIVKVVKAKVCFYEVLGEGDKLNLVRKSEIISGVTPNEKAAAKYFAKLGRVVRVLAVEKIVEKYSLSDDEFFKIAIPVKKES